MVKFLNLSRPRTNTTFIAELDGLRFIAILLVVLHHNHFIIHDALPELVDHGLLWRLYAILAEAGGLGVQLFFIISGMVLGIPFAKARLNNGAPIRLRSYFLRRVRRLEPPYVINLTLLFMLAVMAGGTGVFLERLPHYLASVFYLHNTIYNAWSEVNFVAWSLEVEAQFYLLAPVLAGIFALHLAGIRRTALILAMLAMSLIYLQVQDAPFRYVASILALGQYFLAGYLLADLFVTGLLYGKIPSWWYDIIAAILLALALASKAGAIPGPAEAFGVIPLGLFLFAVFRGHVFLTFLRWPPIFIIGGMCYTIYLYHFWIIQAVIRGFQIEISDYTPLQVLAFDITMTTCVLLVSCFLFMAFERPFMNRQPHKASALQT